MFKGEPVSRNIRVSMITGTMFFTGWWIAIDVWSVYGKDLSGEKTYFIPGFVNTISFIVIRKIPTERLFDSTNYEGGVLGCRLLMFLALIIGFGSLISSIYILVEVIYYAVIHVYVGFAILIQNSLILSSSLLWKFGRTYDDLMM